MAAVAESNQAAERIAALLADNQVPHTVHEHVAVSTIDEAKKLVPELTINLLKTVVFEVHQTPQVLLVAVDRDAAVDYKRVSKLAGCSRRALRLMPGERVSEELGFEIGGVGPFRVDDRISIILDAAIDAASDVKVGGGLRTRTIELKYQELARLGAATIAGVSRSVG